MRSMCLSLLAERPHAFKQFWGGTFCEGIITPPLLTLNMRGTASQGSVVKVNKQGTLFGGTTDAQLSKVIKKLEKRVNELESYVENLADMLRDLEMAQ